MSSIAVGPFSCFYSKCHCAKDCPRTPGGQHETAVLKVCPEKYQVIHHFAGLQILGRSVACLAVRHRICNASIKL